MNEKRFGFSFATADDVLTAVLIEIDPNGILGRTHLSDRYLGPRPFHLGRARIEVDPD